MEFNFSEQPKPEEKKPEEKPSTPATQPQTAQTASTGSGAENSAFEEQVKGLMEMGFAREQVIKALRAAFNNADRAVQYLLSVSSLSVVPLFSEF